MTGFLVDNDSVTGKNRSKVYDTTVRWRFESPRRSRVFKVWKSSKTNVPSLADAVGEGAFEQIRRAVRPDVLQKLKVKRAAVDYRDSQTYKRQRSGPLREQSSAKEVSSPSKPALQIGDSVKVEGLQKRQDLNGLVGKLLYRIEETGRWAVSVFEDIDIGDWGAVINVKPQNLVLCDASSSCENVDNATPIVNAVPAVPGNHVDASHSGKAVQGPPVDGTLSSTVSPQKKRTGNVPDAWMCDCGRHLRRLPHCTGEGPLVVHLQKQLTKFGRGEANDVHLRSFKTPQMLSRNHAVLRQESSTCFLIDQGSLNGVFLNSERVEGEKPLKPGDVVTFGVVTLEPEFDYIFEERPQ